MAYVNNQHCDVCESTTLHINSKCSNCADRRERERIAIWNALTTDEKLIDLRKRVEELERSEIRY